MLEKDKELFDISKRLVKDLKQNISYKRYLHVLRVSRLCLSFAKKFNISVPKAYLASLGHDIAKEFSEHELLEISKMNNIEITKKELSNPALLHPKVGAYILKEKYKIYDGYILQAVSCHTLGSDDMGDLAKILYICDRIEPYKKNFDKKIIKEIKSQDTLEKSFYIVLKNQNFKKYGSEKLEKLFKKLQKKYEIKD